MRKQVVGIWTSFRNKNKEELGADFQSAAELNRQLNAVIQVNKMLIGSLEEDRILDFIAKRLVSVLGISYASIWQWDQSAQTLSLHTVSLPRAAVNFAEDVLKKPLTQIKLSAVNQEARKNHILRCLLEGEILQSEAAYDGSISFATEQQATMIQKLTRFKLLINIPLIANNEKLGTLSIAWKKSIASKADVALMQTFANQITTAIYNSRLFQQTNDQLEQIKQNYLDLQTIQKITSYTISTLDLRELTQKIVDIVPDQLGREYVGATFLRRTAGEGDEFELYAMTQSPLVHKLTDTIKTPIEGALVSLQEHGYTDEVKNRLLTERLPLVDKGLGAVVHPLLPAALSKTIEKLANVQSTVVYPAVFQNRVVGLLVFGLTIPPDGIDDRHLSMMRSVADQIAIGINNAANFDQLREANQELQAAYADLKSLDKAKSEFLSIASHQLRTPLSAIRGYISLVQEGDFGAVPPQQLTVLEKTQDNVKRLVTLVNDLLSLARIEAGTTRKSLRVAKQDFREMIDETVDELKLKALNKELQLIWDKPAKPVIAEFDRDRLEQVVTNLIDNAIYYTESGSITIQLGETADRVELTVKDTGIGINPESMASMFTKFYRAPEAVIVRPDGTGIGLYVAKMMMDIHQGEIWVESEAGKGSEFHIRLPKAQPKSAFAEPETPLGTSLGMLDAEPVDKGITLSDIFHRSF